MATLTLHQLSDPAPAAGPADWNAEGVMYLPGLLTDDLIQHYEDEWSAANGFRDLRDPGNGTGQWSDSAASDPSSLWVLDAEEPGGWPDACPYMRYPALRALCTFPPLAAALAELTGEPMGVHLNLTGWVSTQRNWHQDGYLNPPHVGDFYAAVWMALGDVHPDSGVFQFIPGSHRWHTLTFDKIARVVDVGDPQWPAHSEAVLTPLVEEEIVRRDAQVISYQPRKGDVLVWHPRLYHRGSAPVVENAYRPALIAHYSGVNHRPDMPEPERYWADPSQGPDQHGWLFPIITEQPVR